MGSLFYRIQWAGILLPFFFMVSCNLQLVKKPDEEKEFSQETCRLERLVHSHPDVSVRARSHLKLAFLYVNYRNPQLNYTRALQEMETYLSLSPEKTQTGDFQNWFAVLKEVERLQTSVEEAQKEVGRLQTSLEEAENGNKSLRNEVNVLKEAIKRLKSLDRQIEEKRRLLK
jgi:hypothetical protein